MESNQVANFVGRSGVLNLAIGFLHKFVIRKTHQPVSKMNL